MALRDIALAELTGGVVHIAHMSARQTLDAVRYGKSRGARVTCEVTPHHFVLTDEMLAAPVAVRHQRQDEPAAARGGAIATRCSQGLADGSVDVIATDHAPHHYDEKQVEFDRAPFGITGLETAVSLCFDRLVHARRHLAAAAGRAAVGESGADPERAGRLAVGGRARGHHDPRARSAGHGRRPARMRSKSKNTPFDGWPLRGGVAATIVGGRVVYVNEAHCMRPTEDDFDGQARLSIRGKALKDLQQSEVLMVDGHFDYGNGYHGRVYLNPHQLFRHPSTIWRFAQDLIDVLPGDLVATDRGRRRTGDRRRAARAHDRGVARQPPQPDASALQLRAVQLRPAAASRCARSIARELERQARVLADDVRNTGETFARCAALVAEAGGTVLATVEIYDRCEAIVDLGVPNIPLAEYRAPENYRADSCPLCKAGVPITRF